MVITSVSWSTNVIIPLTWFNAGNMQQIIVVITINDTPNAMPSPSKPHF